MSGKSKTAAIGDLLFPDRPRHSRRMKTRRDMDIVWFSRKIENVSIFPTRPDFCDGSRNSANSVWNCPHSSLFFKTFLIHNFLA